MPAIDDSSAAALVCGAVLGIGLVLVAAPWLWPRSATVARLRSGRVRTLLAEAGFAHRTPRDLVVVCIAAAALAAGVAAIATQLPALVVLAALTGAVAPVAWLRSRRQARARRRRALWPDVCDLLVSAVRAGMPLADAISSLAVSGPVPLRPAFATFASDVAASGQVDVSIRRLKETLADAVADRILETLRMARQVGGTELVPVLRALGSSVRADAAVRAEVEARQSWVRAAAVVGLAAPWAVLGLLALRPEGAAAYASAGGVVLILAGAVVSVVAAQLMARIGRLPAPRRWAR